MQQHRASPNEDKILAIGFDQMHRPVQMVARDQGDRVLIYHAMTPPSEKSSSRAGHGQEVMMKTDREIEEMFGVTREEIEALAAPWDAGGVDGVPVGEVIVGRPLEVRGAFEARGL